MTFTETPRCCCKRPNVLLYITIVLMARMVTGRITPGPFDVSPTRWMFLPLGVSLPGHFAPLDVLQSSVDVSPSVRARSTHLTEWLTIRLSVCALQETLTVG